MTNPAKVALSQSFLLGKEEFDFSEQSCLYFDLELYNCDVLVAGK